MTTSRSRHIGLFLLLVFTSSLWSEGILAAHNIYQLSIESNDYVVSSSKCQDGYKVSDEVLVSVESDLFKFFQRVDLEDDQGQEQEKGKMIISNCSSSLQILPADAPDLIVHPVPSVINSSVRLLSTQVFVNPLADPPRIG